MAGWVDFVRKTLGWLSAAPFTPRGRARPAVWLADPGGTNTAGWAADPAGANTTGWTAED